MFIVTTVEDIIRIPHEHLALPTVQAIFHEIDVKFPNRVLYDVGLCISRYDDKILKLTHGVIVAGDGGAHHSCTFRLVVFRPFMEEVLLGRIYKSSSEGIHITLGFFNNIFIPAYWMLRPSHYEESTGLWVWTPNFDEEEEEEEEEEENEDQKIEGETENGVKIDANEENTNGENGNKIKDENSGENATGESNENAKPMARNMSKVKQEELADEDEGATAASAKNGDKTEDAEEEEEAAAAASDNRYEMEIGSEIRFRVKSINFTQVTNTAKGMQATTSSTAQYSNAGASTAHADESAEVEKGGVMRRKRSSSVGLDQKQVPATLHIIGSICEDGLGLVSWWASNQEEEEEEVADDGAEEGYEEGGEGEYMDEEGDYEKMNGV